MTLEQPQETLRSNYKPPEFRVKHHVMDLQLDFEETTIRNALFVYRSVPAGVPPADLVLDGEGLELAGPVRLRTGQVELPGRSFSEDLFSEGGELANDKFTLDSKKGKLRIDGALLPSATNELFQVVTSVRLTPAKNTGLTGLFVSDKIMSTQCEAESFRQIAFSIDRPDVLATYTVRLKGNKTKFPVLLCNGNQTESGDLSNERHFAIFDDFVPKPTYLFAVVAGVLESMVDWHTKPDGSRVKLNFWCNPEETAMLEWAMEALKRAMKWDEETFGLEYDLEVFNVVAVPTFNCGAMENKSLNIFNSQLLLASQQTSTDSDFFRILRVIGHEYFHNWTGNRVTCRDWFQLTLKEGLTVFREQLFGDSMGSAAVNRIADVHSLRSQQFLEDSGPLKHPIRPESYVVMDNFYTSTVYDKGAEVIRIYQNLLGVEGFKKGLRLYLDRHDGQAATCDEFRQAMADANFVNLDQMQEWYSQAGTPEVRVDSVVRENDRLRIRLTQSIPDCDKFRPLPIPVATGLIGKVSKREIHPTTILHLASESQEFVFEDVHEDCAISFLRGFSAPVRLVHSVEDEELSFLVANDTDPFNRYEAKQNFLKRVILQVASQVNIESGKCRLDSAADVPSRLLDVFRSIIAADIPDLQFKTALLSFPSVDIIQNEMRPCEPLAIWFALAYVKAQLATQLAKEFRVVYDAFPCTPNEYNAVNAGRRAYRNAALAFLTAKDPSVDVQDTAKAKLAYNHYCKATNMTDKMAAMRAISHLVSDEREKAFSEFYEYTKNSTDALNKWFSLQAASDVPHLLEILKALRQHEKFLNWRNPNRVRAIYGSFSSNTPHFHATDGRGYSCLAEAIVEYDGVNCKSAARLIGEFSLFRKYSKSRQELIEPRLREMLHSSLSMDCQELLQKILLEKQ